ncbi:MAG: capsular biosynthesis protein [Myxococcales bacterium]|jgi:capsule polysaccharide modification protein KpsS|nr:capsular biosynthesis protein [Myxococcales bacterium]
MPVERHRILLLQGPMGPFFARLAKELEALGHEVTRLVFNAGDLVFHRGRGVSAFRGTLDELPAAFRSIVEERGIDTVLLFGDGRPIHRVAIPEAERLGLDVYVFEEGYLRPDWITLERGGVNGYSRLPKDPEAYRGVSKPAIEVSPVGPTFGRNGIYATIYSLAMALGRPYFPHYVHHRALSPLPEAFHWVRSGVRKLVYRRLERGMEPKLTGALRGKYFLVPLQVHCDYQLAHSDFESIEAFALEVIATFAAHAPAETHLVLKHHPMDRGYRDYGGLFAREARRLGLEGRLHYIHDQHLPSLLKAARGVVVLNSTVGLQALQHGTPVIALGRGVFVMPGLTHQGTLASFFEAPTPPERGLYRGFRNHLLQTCQANGSFARRLPEVQTPTGVRWHPTAPLGLGSSRPGR